MIYGCHRINRENINTKDYWDNRLLSNNTNNGTSALESILEWLDKNKSINKNSKVLDIGSGQNKIGSFLNNIFKKYNCSCYSFDISEEIKKTWDNSEIVATCGSLPNTGFEKNYFDIILCSHTLEHVNLLEDSCNEIKMILKKDSLAIINSPIGEGWIGEKEHVWWMSDDLNYGIGKIIDSFEGNQYMSMVQIYKKENESE